MYNPPFPVHYPEKHSGSISSHLVLPLLPRPTLTNRQYTTITTLPTTTIPSSITTQQHQTTTNTLPLLLPSHYRCDYPSPSLTPSAINKQHGESSLTTSNQTLTNTSFTNHNHHYHCHSFNSSNHYNHHSPSFSTFPPTYSRHPLRYVLLFKHAPLKPPLFHHHHHQHNLNRFPTPPANHSTVQYSTAQHTLSPPTVHFPLPNKIKSLSTTRQ